MAKKAAAGKKPGTMSAPSQRSAKKTKGTSARGRAALSLSGFAGVRKKNGKHSFVVIMSTTALDAGTTVKNNIKRKSDSMAFDKSNETLSTDRKYVLVSVKGKHNFKPKKGFVDEPEAGDLTITLVSSSGAEQEVDVPVVFIEDFND